MAPNITNKIGGTRYESVIINEMSMGRQNKLAKIKTKVMSTGVKLVMFMK